MAKRAKWPKNPNQFRTLVETICEVRSRKTPWNEIERQFGYNARQVEIACGKLGITRVYPSITRGVELDSMELMIRIWEQRIVPRLAAAGGCMEWTMSTHLFGYGQLTVVKDKVPAKYACHRVALEVKLGRKILAGMRAMHTCDNPKCCNPEHIVEGTQRENMQGASQRNRIPKGEACSWAKMDNKTVLAVYDFVVNKGRSQAEAAKEFGISFQRVSKIARREVWKHILPAA